MKRSFFFTAFIFLLLPFYACEEEQLANSLEHTDYLIFGNFAGECSDDCIQNYLLDMKERALYRISNKKYPYGSQLNLLQSDRYKLADEDFQLAKHLFEKLPEEIMEQANPTIGCPDCRDQGGLYLSFSSAGEVYEFYIDTDKDAIPDFLHDYTDELKAVLWKIRA